MPSAPSGLGVHEASMYGSWSCSCPPGRTRHESPYPLAIKVVEAALLDGGALGTRFVRPGKGPRVAEQAPGRSDPPMV
jgi:hypothetical protein